MRYRISVACIINKIVCDSLNKQAYMSLLNKGAWQKKGKRLFTALGGGAMANLKGEQHLVECYQADFGTASRDDTAVDLRFTVPEDLLQLALSEFDNPNAGLFELPEIGIQREVKELSLIHI